MTSYFTFELRRKVEINFVKNHCPVNVPIFFRVFLSVFSIKYGVKENFEKLPHQCIKDIRFASRNRDVKDLSTTSKHIIVKPIHSSFHSEPKNYSIRK